MRNCIEQITQKSAATTGLSKSFALTVAGVIVSSTIGLGLTTEVVAGRTPLTKMDIRLPSTDINGCRLVIKFTDDSAVRARNGRLLSLTAADMAWVQAILDAHGATVQRRIHMDEATLAQLEAKALQRSGRPQADLAGILEVQVASSLLVPLAEALNARPEIEIAQIMAPSSPPPTMPCVQNDFAPETPDFSDQQGYRGSLQDGGVGISAVHVPTFIDVDEDGIEGIYGEGVAVADIEYCFLEDHEDLCYVTPEPGITPICPFGPDHGTAVLGIMGAIHDSDGSESNIGMRGLSPLADYYFFPEWDAVLGPRRADAILSTANLLPAGSIITLELQTTVWPADPYGDPMVVPYVPAECNFDVFLATEAAVGQGIVVIAAAGNGSQDLDGGDDDYQGSGEFFPYYGVYLSWGDSGAIIVGAGTANGQHERLDFSTFGSPVDVQGWGEQIASLGYGDLLPIDGLIDDRQFYTTGFGGTSGATPIVAGVAAALQGLKLEVGLGQPYNSRQMRDILVDNGVPGGGDAWLGVWAPDGAGPPAFPDAYASATAVLLGGTGPLKGACCLTDNTCETINHVDELSCFAVGGIYRGRGTTCGGHCGTSTENERLSFAGAAGSDEVGLDLVLEPNGEYAAAIAPSRLRPLPNPKRIIYQRDAVTGWEVAVQLDGSISDISVSMSTDELDELRAAFGAPFTADEEGDRRGGVFVYEQSAFNGVWELEDVLYPYLGEPSGYFGIDVELTGAVAIVGDSGWIADGGAGGGYLTSGQQVHVFTRDGLDRWTETGVVSNPGPADFASRFGQVVTIAGDLVIVGAPNHDIPGEDRVDVGAVYLYQLQGDNLNGYTLENVDLDGDGLADRLMQPVIADFGYFGESIDAAVMADGTIRVAIGEPGVVLSPEREGRVWMYELDSSGAQLGSPTEFSPTTLGAADRFGTSVSLSPDGLSLAATTDRGQTEEGEDTGFCWVWHWLDHDGTFAWRELERLQSRFPDAGDRVGTAAAVGVTNGGTLELLAGSPGAAGAADESGAILVWPADYIDCDSDGIHDVLAIVQGVAVDLASPDDLEMPNGIPDSCEDFEMAQRRFIDCNEDGVPDRLQQFADLNGNGRNDDCDEPCFSQWACPGDVAGGDGAVDHDDILAVILNWGTVSSSDLSGRCDIWPPAGSHVLDGDGAVDVLDLITVLRQWGMCTNDSLPDDYCFTLDLDNDGVSDLVFPGWYRQ